MSQTLLEIAIQKKLKTFELKVELSLEAEQGQVLVLFGPSGSGKTMTLRCIAGITNPDAGLISVGGRTVFDSRVGLNVKLSERRVGYLPQNYALFPHLTVAQNIAFGLFSWKKKQTESRVNELVKLMQLDGLERRYPRELSGGQQQRVAFARALAPEPAILLLDEPFSALDAAIRAELRQNLALLSRELGLPVVFITHDLEEAYMLADQIAVYSQGQILQYGSREEIFYRPRNVKVARMVGIRNVWESQVLTLYEPERVAQVRTGFGELWVKIPQAQALPQVGKAVTVCLRPEQISLLVSSTTRSQTTLDGREDELLNRYSGQVVSEIARGSLYTLFFRPYARLQTGVPPSNNAIRASLPHSFDFELEVTAQYYADLKRLQPDLWEVVINPAALHLIQT